MNPNLYFRIVRVFKRNAAKAYYSYFDQNNLLGELPSALRNEVLNSTHKKILDSFSFFRNKPIQFVMNILPNLTKISLSPNDVLYRKGDLIEEGSYIYYKLIFIYI